MNAIADFLDEGAANPWCPGCSHASVTDALGEALARVAPDPRKTVIVSDIGCVGILDRRFYVHTFHGLHGRSVTYATGLKLARPDLTVVVALGDGSLGIGGHHLVEAARRGLQIAVVCFDNFNYGMTGGQSSATTPQGFVTSSAPAGASSRALDACALAKAAGAGFVARVPAFDASLADVLARAIAYPGFAFVDVWEICTAHVMEANGLRRGSLLRLARDLGREFGVLVDAPATAPSQAPAAAAPARVDLAPAFEARLERPLRVVVAGSAGQRVRSAALALARAAVRSGLHATQKDDYPITVRTGHSVSEVILSPRPVRHTGIDAPDAAIVLAPEGLARIRGMLSAMTSEGVVLADEALALPPLAAEVLTIPVADIRRASGAENVALAAVARLAARTGVPPRAALEDVVRASAPAERRERALRALAPA